MQASLQKHNIYERARQYVHFSKSISPIKMFSNENCLYDLQDTLKEKS